MDSKGLHYPAVPGRGIHQGDPRLVLLSCGMVLQIILGILATISILLSDFRMIASHWFWIVWEVVGAALVAIGCLGELYLFMRPAKAGHDDQHRLRELRFISMVAIGVTLEFVGLGYTIPQAIQLEIEVKTLESTNLVLLANLATIESKLQPRHLTKEDSAFLFNHLKAFKGQRIEVVEYILSREAKTFSHEIVAVLNQSGWLIRTNGEMGGAEAEPGVTVFISKGQENVAAGRALTDALRLRSVRTSYVWDGGLIPFPLENGVIGIMVGPKP